MAETIEERLKALEVALENERNERTECCSNDIL